MFIASFGLKTSIQKWLFTLQDFWDFPRLHPAREMKRLALQESVQYAQRQMRTAVGMESSREVLSAALQQVTVRRILPGIRSLQGRNHRLYCKTGRGGATGPRL